MEDSERLHHISLMREALAMANLALTTSETPVGCIIYHAPTSTIIGRGMNATNRSYDGTRHAEFIAINEVLTTLISPPYSLSKTEAEQKLAAGKKKYDQTILKECDIYVTVEPCIMCASLLRQFGIRKVWFGASNEKFGGNGGVVSVQRGNGKVVSDGDVEEEKGKEEGDYEVSGGWLREEAILLLRRFYVQENERAPEPRGKEGRVLKMVVEAVGGGEGWC